jgi:hypothetical protein
LPVSLPVDTDPLSASLPLQDPDAVQAVALADDQMMFVAVLFGIVLVLAAMLIVGAACATVT